MLRNGSSHNVQSPATELPTDAIKKIANPSSNELSAYSTLFKDMVSGVGAGSLNIYSAPAHNQKGNLYNLIPRPCLVEKSAVFLENLESPKMTFKSLVSAGNASNLDFNHCILVVETLAKFHASSYIFRRQLGEKGKGKLEMLKKYPFISQQSNPLYSSRQSEKFTPIFATGFDLACKLIEMENPSLAFKLQRKVPDPSGIFGKIVKFLEDEKYDNDDFYVACHGSSLVENMLFKYDNKEPVECRLTNFDLLYMGPLASDLVLFMLTSTTLSFRQEFEEKLLAFYCDAFQEQVLASGLKNSEIVTEFEENIDEFHLKLEKQYKKLLEFGFYHACVLLPLIEFRKSQVNKAEPLHLSIGEMLTEYSNCFSSDMNQYEKFVLSSSTLGERLVGIVKQLVKARVL